MSVDLLNQSVHIRSDASNVFKNLTSPESIREWFPELLLVDFFGDINWQFIRENHIQFIMRIDQKVPFSHLVGKMISVNNLEDELHFEWTLKEDHNWTLVEMKFMDPAVIKNGCW